MQALGSIEVVGLVAGIEAADVACKTADVTLIGYELAKGGGFVTIKVVGQVAAVTAAMDAAAEAASRLSRVVSKLVIPRPSDQIEPLIRNSMTRGYEPSPTDDEGSPKQGATSSDEGAEGGATTPDSPEAPASETAATAKSTQTRRK